MNTPLARNSNTNNKPKFELTWIVKHEQPKLEPRILIEDSEKFYGYKNTDNMLIYGDNLLALKALEQKTKPNSMVIWLKNILLIKKVNPWLKNMNITNLSIIITLMNRMRKWYRPVAVIGNAEVRGIYIRHLTYPGIYSWSDASS